MREVVNNLDEQGIKSPSLEGRRFCDEVMPVLTKMDFEGPQRTLDALNAGLERAWNQPNPVSRILAKVRCELFKLAPREYSDLMGDISRSTLNHLEMHRNFESARYNPETIHRVISRWNAIVSSSDYRHLESEVSECISELLACVSLGAKTPIHGVMLRWRYRLGPSHFDGETGLNYQQLWSRAHAGRVAPFSELLEHGRKLSLIPTTECLEELEKNQFFNEVRDAWSEESRQLGRSQAMIDLHVAMGVAGVLPDGNELKKANVEVQSRSVVSLRNFQMSPWIKVRAIPNLLYRRGVLSKEQLLELRGRWQAEWARRKPSFEDKLHRLLKDSNLDTRRIADALGITKDDIYKPSLPVFRAVRYGEGSKWISLGVLAHMIVPQSSLRERLLDQKRDEIVQARRLRGSKIESPVAVERELWALKYEDLPFEKRKLQELEWGKSSDLIETEILEQTRLIGEAKAARAVASLHSRNYADSVSELFEHLLFHNGVAKLEGLLGTSQSKINAIREGLEVPSLPRLQDFADKCSITLGESFEDDWRRCSAKLGAVIAGNPLERVLAAHFSEFFETKRELFEKTNPPNRIHRITHGMLDSGTLERRYVSLILKAFDVVAHPNREKFIREVIKSGSVLGGISSWLRGQNSAAVRRLKELGSAEVFGPLTLDDLSQRTLAVNEVLRELPGVTEAELLSALRDEQDPIVSLYGRHIRKLHKLGMSERKLRYIAVGASDRERVPTGMIQQALHRKHPAPVLPLGVVTALCYRQGPALEMALDEARDAVRKVLVLEGTPTSELCIEKRLWGIRVSDISGGAKALQAEVRGDLNSSSGEVLQAVLEVRDKKLSTALKRALYVITARHSAEFLDIASQTCLDSGNEPLREAHLSFSQPRLIKAGGFQVCRDQFEVLGRLADGPTQSVLELYWNFEVASSQNYRAMPPLKRMLGTHILANHVTRGRVEGEQNKRSRDASALEAFAKRGNLRVNDIQELVERSLTTYRLNLTDWAGVIDLCEVAPREKFAQLLQMSVTEQTLSHATARWLWDNRRSRSLMEGWRGVVERASRYLARDSYPQSHLTVSLETALSEDEACVMRLVRGVSAEEIVHIGDSLDKALKRESEKTSMKTATPWFPSSLELAYSLEQRVELLASQIEAGNTVSTDVTEQLLPEIAGVIQRLTLVLGADTAWYVASLACYQDFRSALEVMVTRIDAGRVPKHSGRKHYELHRQWLLERGALGKLGAGSMGLYFGEPFVLPGSISGSSKASRYSGA